MPKRRAPVAMQLPGLESAMAPNSRPVSPASKALTLRAGKGRARGSRCGVAPAPKPWECVVLGVDTAENSGWSLWRKGEYLESGEVPTGEHDALLHVIERGKIVAGASELVYVLVLEFWWGGNARTCAGLHVHCDRWKRAWKGSYEAATRVVTVQPGTWRSAVLGSWAARGGKGLREQVRAAEQSTARGIVRSESVGADQAAAVLIGRWACYAPKIGEAIGKRAVKASQQAWQRGGA
jgi:hypothetical protein